MKLKQNIIIVIETKKAVKLVWTFFEEKVLANFQTFE